MLLNQDSLYIRPNMSLNVFFYRHSENTAYTVRNRRCAMCLQTRMLWSRDADFLLAKASHSILYCMFNTGNIGI